MSHPLYLSFYSVIIRLRFQPLISEKQARLCYLFKLCSLLIHDFCSIQNAVGNQSLIEYRIVWHLSIGLGLKGMDSKMGNPNLFFFYVTDSPRT